MYAGIELVKMENAQDVQKLNMFMSEHVDNGRREFCESHALTDFPLVAYCGYEGDSSYWRWDVMGYFDQYSLTTISVEDFIHKYQKTCTVEDSCKEDKPLNKYHREVKEGVYVDVYDVLRAFNVTDPCLQHMIKKCLANGVRGHKDATEDYEDIVASAKRALELHLEWK